MSKDTNKWENPLWMHKNGVKQKFPYTPLHWAPKKGIENVFKLIFKIFKVMIWFYGWMDGNEVKYESREKIINSFDLWMWFLWGF